MLAEQQLVAAMRRARFSPPLWLAIPVASLTLQVRARQAAAAASPPTPLTGATKGQPARAHVRPAEQRLGQLH